MERVHVSTFLHKIDPGQRGVSGPFDSSIKGTPGNRRKLIFIACELVKTNGAIFIFIEKSGKKNVGQHSFGPASLSVPSGMALSPDF